MPGYEVYAPNGFLLLRCRNGSFSNMSLPRLRRIGQRHSQSHVITNVDILEIQTVQEYNQRIAEQNTIGFRNKNGNVIARAAWRALYRAFVGGEP